MVNLTTSVVSQETSLAERVHQILASFPRERSLLITILERAQEELGFLPNEAIEGIARHLRMSNSEVFGVATFYNFFRLTPSGRYRVQVCRGTACHVRGGPRVLAAVKRFLNMDEGETTPDLKFTLETVACIGACALAPNVIINDITYSQMAAQKMESLLAHLAAEAAEEEVQHGRE